ncbi:MAG: type III pantothenate kinase [Chloroflexi bacterium]|nr:type III pantothenate kinase [Chloroflexota bacterium]
MLLAVDIGNTNVTLGVFKGNDMKATWRMASSVHRESDEYAVMLLNLLQLGSIPASAVSDAAICSVVPPLTPTFVDLCRRYFHSEPLVVETGVKTGIRVAMDNPREVGADRIVDAAAARQLYGGPLIVIDFGTATTFDVVSKEGEYVGGAIAPGVVLAAEALFTRTAQLPRVELAHPKKVIGKGTVSAMQSGIIFGYVSLVEGMVARIQAELGAKTRVIATGGLAGLIAKETRVIENVEPDLTLIGLRMIWEMNRPKDADATR